ncbi:hypothetical protein ABIC60_004874 [Phyllobacterium ifriqiyense]
MDFCQLEGEIHLSELVVLPNILSEAGKLPEMLSTEMYFAGNNAKKINRIIELTRLRALSESFYSSTLVRCSGNLQS